MDLTTHTFRMSTLHKEILTSKENDEEMRGANWIKDTQKEYKKIV